MILEANSILKTENLYTFLFFDFEYIIDEEYIILQFKKLANKVIANKKEVIKWQYVYKACSLYYKGGGYAALKSVFNIIKISDLFETQEEEIEFIKKILQSVPNKVFIVWKDNSINNIIIYEVLK